MENLVSDQIVTSFLKEDRVFKPNTKKSGNQQQSLDNLIEGIKDLKSSVIKWPLKKYS